jgi:hypothetical protein
VFRIGKYQHGPDVLRGLPPRLFRPHAGRIVIWGMGRRLACGAAGLPGPESARSLLLAARLGPPLLEN